MFYHWSASKSGSSHSSALCFYVLMTMCGQHPNVNTLFNKDRGWSN